MIYYIRFREADKIIASYSGETQPEVETHVVFESDGGEEIGKVFKLLDSGQASTRIVRIATEEDIERRQKIAEEEQEVLKLCKEKAKELSIPIRVASTYIRFDRSVLHVDFLAEKKIGLRRLMKELAKVYPERIEFNQIGVRTFAKRFGALGVCGRSICCDSFLKEFKPITVDLMKLQNLSCGTAKLTGICGKLMCCLAYEREAYEMRLREEQEEARKQAREEAAAKENEPDGDSAQEQPEGPTIPGRMRVGRVGRRTRPGAGTRTRSQRSRRDKQSTQEKSPTPTIKRETRPPGDRKEGKDKSPQPSRQDASQTGKQGQQERGRDSDAGTRRREDKRD
jgi:cell fate regulator YaaT (PSP1 superfamily)